ncbi:hypothetical protein [Undibacterium sp. Ren11W]|uniref:hypothetical protein n=1 Tax=Undibacterium sp. Ren11W TaxID=3413045 RepID=UPI003BF2933F
MHYLVAKIKKIERANTNSASPDYFQHKKRWPIGSRHQYHLEKIKRHHVLQNERDKPAQNERAAKLQSILSDLSKKNDSQALVFPANSKFTGI